MTKDTGPSLPSSLPQSFLNRIAAYPATVQRLLASEIDPVTVARHLAVLHGETELGAERLARLMEKPVLTDSLLSRLMTSPRFAERAMALFDALQARGTGAGGSGGAAGLASGAAGAKKRGT